MNKLYPPIIEGVLPAFYLNYDSNGQILKGGSLTIPFAMNNAVSESQVKGFSLRIRTASSGSYILPPIYSNVYNLSKGEVTFDLTAKQASFLNEGQYYKIQIAYCGKQVVDEAGNVSGTDIGYYSTVGVAKCTSKPIVTIRGLEIENINAFNNELFGLYDLSLCKDKTEKVYSYEFKVYDENDEIFFTSGEKLHQAYYDTDYTSSIDRIIINDFASTDVIYSIEYNVTTLNGLYLSSPKYRISSQYLVSSNSTIQILPEADEEHGTITIHFYGDTDPARSYYYVLNDELLQTTELDEDNNPVKDGSGKTMWDVTTENLALQVGNNKLSFLRLNSLYKYYLYNEQKFLYTFLKNNPYDLTPINGKYYQKEDIEGLENISEEYLLTLNCYEKIMPGKDLIKSYTYEYVEKTFIDLREATIIGTTENEKKYYGSYLLSRASDEDNYTTWFNIARFRLDDQVPSDFFIRDITIEHGRKYKYALQQYNIWGLYSARMMSEIFEASFEDAFLYDGERYLRIRYNPTVDSFKTTILEQKTDTIGGKFPFITRNGATYYKEFPLGGLLAQEIDEQHQFVDPNYGEAHRHASQVPKIWDKEKQKWIYPADQPDNFLWNSHDFSDTTIALERNFKLKVLEWLNDGKPKLFKSPYEGNYIIRLMNVSLSPVKELGRMLHSFSSQAYEIAECTYENLVAYGFIKTSMPSDFVGLWRSYDLQDPSLIDSKGDILIALDAGIQNFTIQDMMPGDIIYLTFSDEPEELPIMIGITGSYTYEGISKNLVKIRIPQSVDHKMIGIINVFYEGMRITDFDSIIKMQLKTIISQQYIGTSPWMQQLKLINWDDKNNYGQYWRLLSGSQYEELQNYNFRTFLESTVESTGHASYIPSENFNRLAHSFDPGELLDRVNLSINQGSKYKTEIMNMERLRFRERPLIPVFTESLHSSNFYTPGEYSSLLEERIDPEWTQSEDDDVDRFLCSTSPTGIPHPIEQLIEFEMLDPFCIFQVFERKNTNDTWVPIHGPGDTSYYDPFYRTWMWEDYDPTVKMDYEWVQVACLDKFDSIENALIEDSSLEKIGDELNLKIDSDEYKEINNSPLLLPLLNDQDYLMLTPAARYLYRENIINQDNKRKKENNEYINKAINENEMYDYELHISHYDNINRITYYYYELDGVSQLINNNKFDFYEKINDMYFATGENDISHNKVYWVKKYNIQLNLTVEKMVEYNDTQLMNSYHIGNGVIAELTFQLRIVDYYTEIFDNDVRVAKEAYLNAKQFYSDLMKTYNIIAKADIGMRTNHAFMELYYKLLYGNDYAKLETEDKNNVRSVLNRPTAEAELKLQSLYNITMINTANEAEIIDLLVDYKNKHFYFESDIVAAMQSLELYHYFEETQTKVIDVYYLLDNKNFNDAENLNYIIDTKYGNISDANLGVYRYKYYGDGQIYYYKVNKTRYINDYRRNNQAIAAEDLTIIYNTIDNIFEVVPKINVISTGSELQELEKTDCIFTSSYLDLLNIDEVAALKLEEYFLKLEPVTTNNYALYEITEINQILNDEDFDGVDNKLKAISYEIETNIGDAIYDKQSMLDALTIDYVKSFRKMLQDIEEYNELVYKDWSARVLKELWSNKPALKTALSLASNASDKDIKDTLIAVFNRASNGANIVLSNDAEEIEKYLNAADGLYDYIMGDLPTVQRYIKMIDDNQEEDHDLDAFLEDQIAIQKGQIVLEFYALYDALRHIITILNDSEHNTLTEEEQSEYSIHCQNLIGQYSTLYTLLLDTSGNNANKFKNSNDFDNYNNITKYIDYYYDKYLTLYTQEELNYQDKNYFNLKNLALVSTYQNDLVYLYNAMQANHPNISLNITPTSSMTILGIRPNAVVYNPTTVSPPWQNNNNFYDPLDIVNHPNNIFEGPTDKKYITNMSEANKTTLMDRNHKNILIFFYRSSLSSNIVTSNSENPINYFIFNPLSEVKKDNRLSASLYSSNKIFFDSKSISDRQLILDLYKKLVNILVSILTELTGTTTDVWNAQLDRTYIREGTATNNYWSARSSLINTGSIKIIKDKIDSAKITIAQKKGNQYILRDISPTTYARNVNFTISDTTAPAYFIPRNPNTTTISLDSNWYQDIYIPEDLLIKITNVNSSGGSDASSQLDHRGVYWEYLDIQFIEELQKINKLLDDAEILQRLYQKQVDVYSSKYENYAIDYEINQEIYSSYFGTEAYSYYQALNNNAPIIASTEEERKKILKQREREQNQMIQRYKNNVQQAWWNFLNLLDNRYTAEKERGMYL